MGLFGGWIEDRWNAGTTAVKDLGDAIVDGIVDVWQDIGLPLLESFFNFIGFTDENIEIVQVIHVRLAQGDAPNNFVSTVFKSIVQDTDLIQNVQQLLLTGTVSSAKKYYTYGQNNYIHGLPTVRKTATLVDIPTTQAEMITILGYPLTITTARIGLPTPDFWVREAYQTSVGNSELGFIINQDGKDWTYFSARKNIGLNTAIATLKRETVSNTVESAFMIVGGESVGVHMLGIFSEGGDFRSTGDVGESVGSITVAQEYIADTTVFTVPLTTSYYSVVYTKDGGPTYPFYWKYDRTTEIYPNLTGDFTLAEYTELKVMPVVPLREDFVSLNVVDTNYTTSNTLVSHLQIKMADLITSIEDSPDISVIRDAFLTFTVNLYTTTEAGKEYVYDFLSNMVRTALVSEAMFLAAQGANPVSNTFHVEEQAFNSTIIFNYGKNEIISGSIGDIGTYTTLVTILPLSAESIPQSYIEVSKQVTVNSYEKVTVYGLFQLTGVKTTQDTLRSVISELSNDPDRMLKLNIPLILPELAGYPYSTAEAIIYESLSMMIYTAESQHLAYYETSRFLTFISLVVRIVALVVLIYSFGTASKASTALWSIASQLMLQYVLLRALVLVLESTDNDFFKTVAAVLYVYASVRLGNTNDMISVQGALDMVNALNKVVTVHVAIEGDILRSDARQFLETTTEKQEKLDEISSLLTTDPNIDFFDIAYATEYAPNETPSEFYLRTTQLKNPGVLTLDGPSNYVNNLLTLPKPDNLY